MNRPDSGYLFRAASCAIIGDRDLTYRRFADRSRFLSSFPRKRHPVYRRERSFPARYLSEPIRRGNPAVCQSTLRAPPRRQLDTADYRGKTRKCSETIRNGRKRATDERARAEREEPREETKSNGRGRRAATLHTFIRDRAAEESSCAVCYYLITSLRKWSSSR